MINQMFMTFVQNFIPASNSLAEIKFASFLITRAIKGDSFCLLIKKEDFIKSSGIDECQLLKTIKLAEEQGWIKIIGNKENENLIDIKIIPSSFLQPGNYKDSVKQEKDQFDCENINKNNTIDHDHIDHDQFKYINNDLINKMINIGVFSQTAVSIVNKWKPEKIDEKIKLIGVLESKGIKIKNKAGFLIKAIEKDYPLYKGNNKKSEKKEKIENKTEYLTSEEELKQIKNIEDYKESLSKKERTKLRQRAYEKVIEDMGTGYNKVSETSLNIYENLILKKQLEEDGNKLKFNDEKKEQKYGRAGENINNKIACA